MATSGPITYLVMEDQFLLDAVRRVLAGQRMQQLIPSDSDTLAVRIRIVLATSPVLPRANRYDDSSCNLRVS
jgi:hypothetical protein